MNKKCTVYFKVDKTSYSMEKEFKISNSKSMTECIKIMLQDIELKFKNATIASILFHEVSI